MEDIKQTKKSAIELYLERYLKGHIETVLPPLLESVNLSCKNLRGCNSSVDWKSILTVRQSIQSLQAYLNDLSELEEKLTPHMISQWSREINRVRQQVLTELANAEMVLKCHTTASSVHTKDEKCPSAVDGMEQAFMPVQNLSAQEEERFLTEVREEQERAMRGIATDMEDIHEAMVTMRAMTREQSESVDHVETLVEDTAENIDAGEKTLRNALRSKLVILPAGGALLGSLAGGPIGLILGAKVGGLAAVSGGLAGFLGGRFLKQRAEKMSKNHTEVSEVSSNIVSPDKKNS